MGADRRRRSLGSVIARTVEAVAARTAGSVFGVAGWSPDTEADRGSMDWMPLGDYEAFRRSGSPAHGGRKSRGGARGSAGR